MAQQYRICLSNEGDGGSIPESGRSPGGGNGTPLQYSYLRNPMERRALWAAVHGVTRVRYYLTVINNKCGSTVWRSGKHSRVI